MLSKKCCKDSGFFLITNFLHLVFFRIRTVRIPALRGGNRSEPRNRNKIADFFSKIFCSFSLY